MTSFARWFALLPLLTLAATIPACASDSNDDPSNTPAETGDEEEVVDVTNSKVKDQAIGNCWVYATSGWAESLRMSYSGEELNLSESYTSYIDWFYGIQAGDFDVAGEGLQTGGWFGEAAEYMRRFGVMDEGAFIPEEANLDRSVRQKTALNAINASLKTGVLSKPENRKNPSVVRDELDKAFGLSADVIALLDQSFGHDMAKTIPKGATIPANKGIRKPSDIEVGYYKPKTGTARKVTLADAIGLPSSESSVYGWKLRTGQFAWNETIYPASAAAQRPFQIKLQRTLNNRQAAIMVWFVDFNAMDRSNGSFKAIPATIGSQGGHMTVFEDYQVKLADGTVLAAGVNATPEQLTAALDSKATLEFLRVKNSWGSKLAPPAGSTLNGYHDLYMPYLNGQIPKCDKKDAAGKCISPSSQRGLTAVVLPADVWADVTFAPPATNPTPPTNPTTPSTCAHKTSETGDKLVSSCDPCVKTVCDADSYCCSTKWDGQCVKEAASMCKK